MPMNPPRPDNRDPDRSRPDSSRDERPRGPDRPGGIARRSLLGGAGALLGGAVAVAGSRGATAAEAGTAELEPGRDADAGRATEHRQAYYRLARF